MRENLAAFMLVWSVMGVVGILAGLLLAKLMKPMAKAVQTDELGQTRQGENYDGD